MDLDKITFDQNYYKKVMNTFEYNHEDFSEISFALGKIPTDVLKRIWLCHMDGDLFAKKVQEKKKCIVTTGFGLSGVPHMGTFSQILRILRIQRAGIPVQIVLGDLDAYNGKNIDLEKTQVLAKKYKDFILNLGFQEGRQGILRDQFNSLSTLRVSYLLGKYMNDTAFNESEEDLHSVYVKSGKVDKDMSHRRKLSLNLMIADFIELFSDGNEAVMVMLGIDEHKYVKFGKDVFENFKNSPEGYPKDRVFSAMYSGIIQGLNGHSKMSKSFPGSGITVNMKPEEIRNLILNEKDDTRIPEINVLYQLMSSVSLYSDMKLMDAYQSCVNNSKKWMQIKEDYAEHLIELCNHWKN